MDGVEVDGGPTLELELDLQLFLSFVFFAPSVRRWCPSVVYEHVCTYLLAKLQSRLVQPGVQIQGHTGQGHDKGAAVE